MARRLPSGAASSRFLDPPSWRRDVRPEDSGPIRARATWRMTLGAGSEQGRRPTGEPMRDALTLWIVKAVLSPWPPRRRLYQRICGPVFDPGKPVGGWATKLRRVNVGTTPMSVFTALRALQGEELRTATLMGGLWRPGLRVWLVSPISTAMTGV